MTALSHLRVVEVGSAAAASYCARMFADFGAEVVKIEPASGDPLRRAGPLTPGGNSAWFAFLNAGKSSVVCDDAEALTDRLADCDRADRWACARRGLMPQHRSRAGART